jgi:hypothetical protein
VRSLWPQERTTKTRQSIDQRTEDFLEFEAFEFSDWRRPDLSDDISFQVVVESAPETSKVWIETPGSWRY